MATKKQRRRRAKEHRHDYVWVDEEGNEVESEGGTGNGKSAAGRPTVKSGRTAQPPSWRRSLRRGAIFAPIMFGTVLLLSKHLTLSQQITQTLLIVVVFVPFTYFLDRVFYTSALRRQAKAAGRDGKRGG